MRFYRAPPPATNPGREERHEAAAIERENARLAPAMPVDAPVAAVPGRVWGEAGEAGGAGEAAAEERLAVTPTAALVREAAVRRNPDVRAALAEARAAGADLRERENVLGAAALSTYAGLYLARRELSIVDENLVLLGRFVEIARSKYAAGTATQPDVLRAEVERDNLRAERAARASAVETATSALNVLLDRPPEAAIGPIAALPEPPTPTAATLSLLSRAIETRPELRAATERVDASDAALGRARQEWIPDLAVGGGYARSYGMVPEDQLALSGGVTLPIWWGRIRARIAEAEAGARRARADLRATRDRVLDQVKQASARLEAAIERHRILAEEAVPKARQNLRASEAAYTTDQIDFLTLIDTQRMLLASEIEEERALAERTVRIADLERALGTGAGEAARPEGE